MDYTKQKAACADYARNYGGAVADVLRTSGRKGAVILSKDGRILYDPFVMEPVKELITETPKTEPAKVETPKPSQKKKSGARKK